MLRQSGVDAGRWLARRLMQEYGLTSHQPVKHRYGEIQTTAQHHQTY